MSQWRVCCGISRALDIPQVGSRGRAALKPNASLHASGARGSFACCLGVPKPGCFKPGCWKAERCRTANLGSKQKRLRERIGRQDLSQKVPSKKGLRESHFLQAIIGKTHTQNLQILREDTLGAACSAGPFAHFRRTEEIKRDPLTFSNLVVSHVYAKGSFAAFCCSFAPFCALLRTCVCTLLRSFACFCV